ncbi:MAG: UBP-type zinc finger domain-containing protein [Chloroflexota bacterium]
MLHRPARRSVPPPSASRHSDSSTSHPRRCLQSLCNARSRSLPGSPDGGRLRLTHHLSTGAARSHSHTWRSRSSISRAPWLRQPGARVAPVTARDPNDIPGDEERSCEHVEIVGRARQLEAPLAVCSSCVEMGGRWEHLRQCLTCGRTSCCNLSPNRHATAHFQETGHPMIRSAEPGEDWRWCYPDDRLYLGDEVREETAEV